MRFSASLKSSNHCLPSPDGKLVATLFSSVVNIRAVDSLDITNVAKLPHDLSGLVLSFQWSPSSRLLLVATASVIHVLSAEQDVFQATIRNAVPPATRPSFVGFGPSSTEVCVCSSVGLKFSIFDLTSSAAVEIPNPKCFSSASARNGFSYRPRSHHLALLTRTAGKDVVSIHDPATREETRSWSPDTVDAQGLRWSPDGRWLVVWESAGQGHKVIFYTADGQVFKTWLGPVDPAPELQHHALGAGVKALQFSGDGGTLAIGDSSRCAYLLDMASVTETMRLAHPGSITPSETVQIWQEQVSASQAGPALHSFVRATQVVSPPERRRDNSEPKAGCASILFDPCSSLVATRLEDSPSTVWVWDTQASELRAALLFHSPISAAAWHPTARETLLLRCEGELHGQSAFVWDPLSGGPWVVDFGAHLPPRPEAAVGPPRVMWLATTDPAQAPAMFFSRADSYVLASLAESEGEAPPWQEGPPAGGGWATAGLTSHRCS